MTAIAAFGVVFVAANLIGGVLVPPLLCLSPLLENPPSAGLIEAGRLRVAREIWQRHYGACAFAVGYEEVEDSAGSGYFEATALC